MNEFYEELVDRIRGETHDLDRLVQRSLLAFADFLSEVAQASQT